MPYNNCKICKNSFYAKQNWIVRGWGKYCSKPCQYQAQLNGKIVNCTWCDKEVYRALKDLKKSKSKNYFCNKSCFASWKNETQFSIGQSHFNWKHGGGSYRNIMLREGMSQICGECSIKDKRVLVVHHLDKNRKNNSLENLRWLCRNCHYLAHKGQTV